jgi:uncharacterized integral membrane protein
MRGYILGALFFAVAMALFVFQNDSQVAIKFLTWTSPKISIALVVLAAACTGALITFFIDGMRYFKVVRKLREVLADNNKLNKQLKQLQDDRASQKADRSGVSHGTEEKQPTQKQ